MDILNAVIILVLGIAGWEVGKATSRRVREEFRLRHRMYRLQHQVETTIQKMSLYSLPPEKAAEQLMEALKESGRW